MSQTPNENEKETVRFTLDLPPDLHKEFKIAAVGEGVSMRELAMRWIREGIDRINPPAKKR